MSNPLPPTVHLLSFLLNRVRGTELFIVENNSDNTQRFDYNSRHPLPPETLV